MRYSGGQLMNMDDQQRPTDAGRHTMAELPPQPPLKRPKKGRGALRELVSIVSIIAAAFTIALLLIAYVYQPYAVDGPSMQQTLHDKDRLIVWKVPRTWARITHHAYIPKRGDIIVFQQSNLSEFGQDNSRQLIKRVIGLPGERIVVKDGAVTVYNADHPAGFQPDKTLPYGKDGAIPISNGNLDVTLGKDELFVCGDNRPDSLDSRSFGPINADQVIGKLLVRILPLSDAERF